MDIENPVTRQMLDELRGELPDLWPQVHQWLRTPLCLRLVHFFNSAPSSWHTLADLAWQTGDSEDQIREALGCLLDEKSVIRLQIPETGTDLYRLTDQEPEREALVYFQNWCQRWRVRIEAANAVVGQGWHWGEKHVKRGEVDGEATDHGCR